LESLDGATMHMSRRHAFTLASSARMNAINPAVDIASTRYCWRGAASGQGLKL